MNNSKHIPIDFKRTLIIIDEETEFLFSGLQDATYVISEKELTVNYFEIGVFNKIIVLAELNWRGKYLQHFFGFDIAVDLRREYRIKCPIIIISTFPRYWFEKLAEKELKYKMIYGRGTAFLHIYEFDEKLEQTIKSVQPLNEAVLSDINEMLLNMKGVVVDKLTHDLRYGMEKQTLQQVLQATSGLLNQQQRNALGWPEFEKRLKAALTDEETFYKAKEGLLLRCDQELMDTESPVKDDAQKKHKVLFLEDDEHFTEMIRQNLKDHFEELLVTQSAEQAIQWLDEDGQNTITGIVADWRLYTGPEKKYWQLQGYEVLVHAAKTRFMALFSLTSLADKNLNNIRNMLGLDIHLFKKNYLYGEGRAQWDVMADTIRQKCDEVVEVIGSQPTGTGWGKLKIKYIQKRHSGWETFENEVGTEADRVFAYYQKAIEKEDIRNVYSIGEMGFSLKNDLKNTLIIRRIYLGLYFTLTKGNNYLQDIIPPSLLGDGGVLDTELKHHSIDVHSILRKDWWDDLSAGLDSTKIEEVWGKFEQRIKNLRSSLCIELSAFPTKGILPEEKSWLTKNNIDFGFLFNYW